MSSDVDYNRSYYKRALCCVHNTEKIVRNSGLTVANYGTSITCDVAFVYVNWMYRLLEGVSGIDCSRIWLGNYTEISVKVVLLHIRLGFSIVLYRVSYNTLNILYLLYSYYIIKRIIKCIFEPNNKYKNKINRCTRLYN